MKSKRVNDHIFLAFLFGLLLSFAPHALAEDAATAESVAEVKTEVHELHLEAAIAQALASYPGITAARHAVAAAKAQLDEAYGSRFLPQFSATSLFGIVPNVPEGSAQPNFPDVDQSIFSQDYDFFVRLRVEALQPVYTFGRLTNLSKLARAGLDASRQQFRDEIQELIFNVKRVYFALQALTESEAFLRDIESKLNTVNERIDEMLAKGDSSITQSDKFQVKVFAADLESRLIDVENNRERLIEGLYVLLGVQADGDRLAYKVDRQKKIASSADLDLMQVVADVK